jgi:hypothetical protein
MKRILTICSAAALCLSMLGARAATPDLGTLTQEAPLVTWTGTFDGIHPQAPSPEIACLPQACDFFELNIQLGDLWQTADGAVEVAVRWPYDGLSDLDLIVSRDGQEVGRSAGNDSNAESVFIDEPENGEYVVMIAPSNNFSDAGPLTIDYEGLAELQITPDGTGDDLLPNLTALRPDGFHIASAGGLLPFPENPVLSCYAEETIERPEHPIRCLRFNQTIANTGDGPLELRFRVDQALSPNTADHRMEQRIYTDDGTYRDRLADSYEFHAVHGHVHYRGFGQSYLYAFDVEQDRRASSEPVRVGNKVGFCVIDVLLLDDYWGATEGAKANGPRSKVFPTCLLPKEPDQTGAMWLEQGIDVGWADVYGWNLPDQYMDITGLAPGIYEIEQVANPNGSVTETTTGDNCASAVIEITDSSVQIVEGATPTVGCTTVIELTP